MNATNHNALPAVSCGFCGDRVTLHGRAPVCPSCGVPEDQASGLTRRALDAGVGSRVRVLARAAGGWEGEHFRGHLEAVTDDGFLILRLAGDVTEAIHVTEVLVVEPTPTEP